MGGRTAAVTSNEPARPMTAVRAAGYTTFANKSRDLTKRKSQNKFFSVQASEKTVNIDNIGERLV